MNFGIREWMLLIGGLLFLAVVIDGLRRVLKDRREEVRLSRNARKGFPSLDDGETKNSELSSRARTVARCAEMQREALYEREVEVPVLLDPISENELETIVTTADEADIGAGQTPIMTDDLVHNSLAYEPSQVSSDAEEAEQDRVDESIESRPEVEEVILINVHARDGAMLNGQLMLETLLEQDVRFGSMDIFHKRETHNSQSRIQFSMVNSVEPGTFNLDEFDSFETPGVTLFMQLPGPDKPMAAYKDMLATAYALAQALDGVLLDEQRNAIHQQTLEHLKQKIEDFERKSLLKNKQ